VPEPYTDVDRLCIDTIRTLAIDAVQAANSGHPGSPLSLAPAYVLFARVMLRHPADPAWPTAEEVAAARAELAQL
jgi:transketolase